MAEKKKYTNVKKSDDLIAIEKKRSYLHILLVVLVLAILAGAFGMYLMKQYENSILNVYARQQDAYVQLINDQINLEADRSDYEIIKNILGTLESSDKTYWTLTEDQSIVYVKNILETNRYKGVSAATVYNTPSGQEFIKNLNVDHVVHGIIRMDNNSRYVASGSAFKYNNAIYRLCLLTDDSVILDNNYYLATKIAMNIFWIAMLFSFVIIAVVAIINLQKQNAVIMDKQNQIKNLNIKLEAMDNERKLNELFGSKLNVYQDIVLERFVSNFDARNLEKLVFCHITFDSAEDRDEFLQEALSMLDYQVLRFYSGEKDLDLLFVKYSLQEARVALDRMSTFKESDMICKEYDADKDYQYLSVVYDDFIGEFR